MNTARFFHRWLRGAIVGFFAALIVASDAEPASFVSKLSPENKTASGIVRLTGQQIAALDKQIQREVSLAHQGDTMAFASTFTHRRTPMQHTEAGLHTLATPELATLDKLVAAAVADRPPPFAPIASPSTTTPISVQMIPRKMEVHSEVTFAYVWAAAVATAMEPP